MTVAVVFPGQGSQQRGMGEELFDRFPAEMHIADSVVGYSLRDLCLGSDEAKLRDTRFTQPALFVVSALSYLAWREAGKRADVFAGHSLGEYAALFAAGVFDFATGVRLVKTRGELMSQASGGGMAAVIGLPVDTIRPTIESAGLVGTDIANYNSQDQTVITGPTEEIARGEPLFTALGARYAVLNVGAAFHSRYMAPTADAFARVLQEVEIKAPSTPVIANVTARPYEHDPDVIRATMARQIASSVRWYETVSLLLAQPDPQIEELGPGTVLRKLVTRISLAPLPVRDARLTTPTPAPEPPRVHVRAEPARLAAKNGVAWMYTGEGSQYYGMGEGLYRESQVYRDAFDLCDSMARPKIAASIASLLYDGMDGNGRELDRFLHSSVANFALGYALSQVLFDQGAEPDVVVGYGGGELVAATIAGGLTLEQAIEATIAYAREVEAHVRGGAILAVFDTPAAVPPPAAISGYNFARHCLVSGTANDIERLQRELAGRGVVCHPLPVRHALHSIAVEAVESAFCESIAHYAYAPLQRKFYSPALSGWINAVDGDVIWAALRRPVCFGDAIRALHHSGVRRFVDLGPSGTMAGFVRYELDDKQAAVSAINRFGRNAATLENLIGALREVPA